jgi:Gas vesicle synthesis protein GvpL/GvpF
MGDQGRYLYAVTRRAEQPVAGTGLRGEPLRSIEHRGLVAVVSDVALDEFGEEGLARNLEDLEWLSEVARTHDDVVRRVARTGSVAPLRLATICLDDDAVQSRLDDWHDQLDSALARVEGCAEWSVKVFASATTEDTAQVASEEGVGAGAAYLRRKRDRAQRRQAVEQASMEVAEAVHRMASEHAHASRRLAAQDPRLTGYTGSMVLNGAYLVPEADQEDFVAALAALSREHEDLSIDVQGPWPPYSFATLDAP